MPFSAAPATVAEYLTYRELQERWHISRTTAWSYAKNGIPGTTMRLNPVKVGGRVLIRLATVEAIEAALAPERAQVPARRRRRRAA